MNESDLTPYQWCQRFARGEVERVQLIDTLARYQYAQRFDDHAWNEVVVQPPGAVDEIEEAVEDGLIDTTTYAAILDRIRQLRG